MLRVAGRLGSHLLRGAVIVWVVTAFTFVLVRSMPGNPVQAQYELLLERGMSPDAARRQTQITYGFINHGSMWDQYRTYLVQLAHFNLGQSIQAQGVPVTREVLSAARWTIGLVLAGVLISFVLGVVLGVIAAMRRSTRIGDGLSVIGSLLHGIPQYVMALALVTLFTVKWRLFSSGPANVLIQPGFNAAYLASLVSHAVLPALAFALSSFGGYLLTMKSSVISVLGDDFILAAELRGLSKGLVFRYVAQRDATAVHGARTVVRVHVRRRGLHRKRLQLPRHGPAAGRQREPPRLLHDERCLPADHRRRRAGQHRRRPAVLRDRPAGTPRRRRRQMTTTIEVPAATGTPATPRVRRGGFWRNLWKVLRRKPSRMFGAIVIVIFIVMAAIGPLLYPSPLPTDPNLLMSGPSLSHPLGTDFEGADVLALLVIGTRYVLVAAAVGAVIMVVIGVGIGLYAGFRRGRPDSALMAVTDFVLTIPGFPLLLVLSTVWKFSSALQMGLVLGITGWGGLARSVRSQALSLRTRGFVEAARGLGFSTQHVVVKELLPNIAPFVAMNLLIGVTGLIYSQVGLFFLGVLPFTSSNWGVMINLAVTNGVTTTGVGLCYLLAPLVAVLLLTLSVVLLVDAMDEVFNPRLRDR